MASFPYNFPICTANVWDILQMHSAQATENPESGSRISTVEILTAPTTQSAADDDAEDRFFTLFRPMSHFF